MRRTLLLILFFAVSCISYGQDTLRRFDEQKWKEIVGDVTFEEEATEKEKPKKQEEEKPSSGWSLPGIPPQVLQIIGFGLVFALFAYILYYVSKNTRLTQNIRSMKATDAAAPVENIEELDIDTLLRDALASGDLRLAVRVHYLLLLKKLNEVGLITWKKNKTNRDYLSELYGRNACYDDVRSLTVAYELVWYGERGVTSESFRHLSNSFESVNRQITEVRPTP